MIKQLFFVFAFLLVISGYSQEYFQSNTIVKQKITFDNVSEGGSGHKIFSLLGLENNLNTRNISLDAKARVLIRISRDINNNLSANISITRVSLKGVTSIRDFAVDTLLWPSNFSALLTIYKNGREQHIIKVSASAYGTMETIDLSSYFSDDIEKISATLTDFRYFYNEEKFQKLQSLTLTIHYYYSYGKLLNNIINQHSGNSTNTNQNVEKLFVDKIEISRVINYIDKHNFVAKLNLEENDPIGFIRSEKKLYRLSSRCATLTKQQFSNNISDELNPLDFCNKYFNLSSYYINQGNLLQPSDATGFDEVAAIDPSENSKAEMALITSYYSRNTSINSDEIDQCIFNGFVDKAVEVISDNNFTDGLLLLNNANIIHNWFGTTKMEVYKKYVITALNGVASSYLSVGNAALNVQNTEFASKYFNKADEVVESNRAIILDTHFPDTAFAEYLELQYEIAIKYIESDKFVTALNRLENASFICTELDSSTICNLIDSAIYLAHSGYINTVMDSLDNMTSNNKFNRAYKLTLKTAQYIHENNCYCKDVNARFEELAQSLLLELQLYGEELLMNEQTALALDALLKARLVQQYVPEKSKELDRLIQFAAEPEIISLIDKAVYHTWANRMDEANNLYLEATKLNVKYFNKTNIRINVALHDLSEQMRLRNCILYSNKYSDAIKNAHISIKKNEFDRLNDLLKQADTISANHTECNINNDEARIVIIERLRQVLMNTYQAYLLADQRACIKAIENLWSKYAVTAKVIEDARDVASEKLQEFMVELGYE